MSRTNKQIVWHYTYSHNIKAILESGVLLPPRMTPGYLSRSAAFVLAGNDLTHPDIKAAASLLLFSQREDWEPASYRGLGDRDGNVFDLHRLEDYEVYGMDVFRIGVSRSLLHPWIRLKEMSKMSAVMAFGLEKTARGMGSNPFDWWGTMHSIPKNKWRAVEVYNPETKAWEPVTEVPKVEKQLAEPEVVGEVVFDEEGNVIAGRAILEEIIANGKPKSVLVRYNSMGEVNNG